MSEDTSGVWFYSRNGQRAGPVSREQLEKMAAARQLNPRYDHCWTQGMDQWVPAGEVEGLFDRKPADGSAENTAPTGKSPYQPPRQESKLSETELERELRTAKWPGATRRVYIFATWVLPFIFAAAIVLLTEILLDLENPDDAAVLPLLSGIAALVLFGFVIYVWLLRFTNLGMSRWWILGAFVPLLNLWVGYRTLCCPAGYEYHRKLDGIGIFLAILYWGPMVLGLALMVLSFAVLLGAAGGMFGGFEEILERMMEEMEQMDDGLTRPDGE